MERVARSHLPLLHFSKSDNENVISEGEGREVINSLHYFRREQGAGLSCEDVLDALESTACA